MQIKQADIQPLTAALKSQATNRLNGNITLAEDIAQEVLLTLLEYNVEQAEQWNIYALGALLCKRKCVDHVRKEARRIEIEQASGGAINASLTSQSAESLATDPFDSIAVEEMLSRFNDLSPMLRCTVKEHYLRGKSVRELATAQKVTKGVIYKRLQRARDIVTGDNQ